MIITKKMTEKSVVLDKDLWQTPDHIFGKLDKMFSFNLDPCCTVESARCSVFYTPKENGLSQDWSLRWPKTSAFVNPPYSRGNIDKWVDKCLLESSRGSNVVALLPVSTSSDWFKSIIGNTFYWVDKRIRFKGAPFTAPFSSVIVHFNGIDRNISFTQ